MTQSHPCFSPDARYAYGRLHLPVAPKVNVRGKYDDAMYLASAQNVVEKAPQCLLPAEGLAYLDRVLASGIELAMVGISGPGEPFATPDTTFETLRLVREKYPDMGLCVATNGLGVSSYASVLGSLGLAHVTVLINGVDPDVVEKLYGWIRPGTKTMRLTEAAEYLVGDQLAAIVALRKAGVSVKVNTTVYPGINDKHIGDIAARVASLGVELMHIIPFIPPWEGATDMKKPDVETMLRLRTDAAKYLPVMEAPDLCGEMIIGFMGDACGTGHELITPEAALPLPGGDKPYVAVASSDGYDVNEHLGHARKLLIYGPKNGPVSLLEARPAPAPGSGDNRWEILAEVLKDCKYLLVSSAGNRPKEVLAERGIRVIQTEENIEGLVDVLFGGGKGGKKGKKNN